MENKCKICGVDIEAPEGERIDICENCRARQAEATPACEQREQAPQDVDVQAQAADPAVYIAPLLKRAYDFLQSRNFIKADEYFERVLDIDLNNDEALLGKLLVEGGVTELSAFESTTRAVYMAKSYVLIMSHGSEELKGKINALCEKIDENVFVKGDQFLKSRNFKTAIEAYKRYIKRKGKSKAAILGLLLATYKVSSVEELSKGTASIKENSLYLELLSSDDEKLKNELTAASEKIEARRKRIKSKLILSAIITASVAVVTAVSIIIGVAIYRSSDEYVYDLEEGKGGYIIGDFKDDDPIEGGHLEVPKELGGGNVVAIDEGAFKDREDITSVYIPDEIKEIGKGAFSGCESITEINIPFLGKNEADTVNNTLNHIFDGNIPKSLKRVTVRGGSIGEKAFFGCGQIESVTLPSGIKTIGASTFSGCASLKSIKLPSGVTSIGISAFKGCSSLGKVTLPNGIKTIGEGAFEGCTGITEVVIPKSLESMGFGAFKGCTGMTRIELPFVGNDRGSTVSPRLSYAFGAMDSSLISAVMPKGLKTVVLTDIEQIPNFAFAECSLISTVIIPDGVVTICDYAFYKCTDIKEISIPASVKTIGKGAF
ncbi:MAG: leucine-rich repeat domain-containing protein, partial [Clostridia bacterium]|nr:leucine-rich repeat domain-containing protein [Clostridia bacterium]